MWKVNSLLNLITPGSAMCSAITLTQYIKLFGMFGVLIGELVVASIPICHALGTA